MAPIRKDNDLASFPAKPKTPGFLGFVVMLLDRLGRKIVNREFLGIAAEFFGGTTQSLVPAKGARIAQPEVIHCENCACYSNDND